jgi:transcriptional regulator with XRE-family HTH domain
MPPVPTVRANGTAIRAFAEKDDLTINGLAELAGVAGSAVHNYVHETKQPTKQTLIKIAKALGVPLQAICMDDLTESAKVDA